jgi:hypothetical protein
MNRLITKRYALDSRFRREILESLRGALHLNLFDTSPLQVHTHANFLHARVYSGTERICDDVHASASKLFAFADMRRVPPDKRNQR